jgi:hypothetical protein
MLARQSLYHFTHASSPFCFGYFRHGVIRTIYPGWPHSNQPDLSLQNSKDYRCEPPASGCLNILLKRLKLWTWGVSKLLQQYFSVLIYTHLGRQAFPDLVQIPLSTSCMIHLFIHQILCSYYVSGDELNRRNKMVEHARHGACRLVWKQDILHWLASWTLAAGPTLLRNPKSTLLQAHPGWKQGCFFLPCHP